jgi:hypothetical protein
MRLLPSVRRTATTVATTALAFGLAAIPTPASADQPAPILPGSSFGFQLPASQIVPTGIETWTGIQALLRTL